MIQIDQDFELKFQYAGDKFLSRFPSHYTNKILGYTKRYRPDILMKVEDLVMDGE